MDKFQQRFIDEAREYCDRLEQDLIDLEQQPHKQEIIAEVFRIMHSLKGSGAMFGFSLISELTHDLESVYDLLREGKLNMDPSIIDFTLKSVDLIKKLLNPEETEAHREQVNRMKAEMKGLVPGSANPDVAVAVLEEQQGVLAAKRDMKSYYIRFEPGENVLENGINPLYLIDELNSLGTCRIEADMSKVPTMDSLLVGKCYTSWKAVLNTDVDKGEIQDVFLFVQDNSVIDIREIPDPHVLQKEDVLKQIFQDGPEIVMNGRGVARNSSAKEEPGPSKKIFKGNDVKESSLSTIRVNSLKIDSYINLVSEMIIAESRLFNLASKRKDKELEALAEHFKKLIRQMRNNAFDMSLVPLFSVVTRFKRMVRDLSGELDKNVNLVLEGLDTEVDKNMIEKLANPMMHIVRNCIDHGIESPGNRVALGKPSSGTITIRAGYTGTFVEINIEDDGQGLDLEKIRSTAVRKGFLSEEQDPEEEDLIKFIFMPGFSTSEEVTDVSGRGVGMDVAGKIIRELRGDLLVKTEKGQGTRFTIRLPLTLSIVDGLLVKIADSYCIIPLTDIRKIYPLRKNKSQEKIRQVEVIDGMEIPYLDLPMEFYHASESRSQQYLIAVAYKKSVFGLVVDEVLREYQAVVKPIGKLMKNQDIFLGVSILGDGSVSLVLDVKMVIQKYAE